MTDIRSNSDKSTSIIVTFTIIYVLLGATLAPIAVASPDNTTDNTTIAAENATNTTVEQFSGNTNRGENVSSTENTTAEMAVSGGENNTTKATDSTTNSSTATVPEASPEVTSAVAAGSGEKTVIVRFSEPEQLPASAANAEPVGKMKTTATSSQSRFERFAAGNPHVEIKDSFWIANAKLVKVDTAQVPLRRLAGIENVRLIHRNFKVNAPDPEPISESDTAGTQQFSPAGSGYTWGLKDTRVPETWQKFDNRGNGVSVAVLDTGVAESHSDIDVAKWKDFNEYAPESVDDDVEPSPTPIDYGSHGTHVSGTVVGGDASGTHIGVAPNAKLYVGAVLTELQDGGRVGYFSQILAGMQWAVDKDADILSMSLGRDINDISQAAYYIEPFENVRDAGTIPVVAVGNVGAGDSSRPGNLYSTISIGATENPPDRYGDINNTIPTFSSGTTIDTSEWTPNEENVNIPEYWPRPNYTVPDLVAPGRGINSSVPPDEYLEFDGTSMATPHVSGGLALILSNSNEDLSPSEARNLLQNTADDLGHPRDRQGAGELDIYQATLRHSWGSLQPTLSPQQTGISQRTELSVDVNHPIDAYYWRLPNGSTVKTTDATLNHSFETGGDTVEVDIIFNDVRDKNQTVTKTVDVTDLTPPTAVLSANRTTAEISSEAVRFNASDSSDNGAIDHYEWDFGDGTTASTTEPVINHTYTTTGEKTVTLTVVDTNSNTNQTTLTVTAQDTIAPTPRISAPASAFVGESITLSAASSTDNGQISSYSWEIEGEPSKSGQSVSYTFDTDETKTINLTVTDAAGNTNSTNTTVTVNPVPQVTITQPTEDSYIDTDTVSLQYTLEDTGVVNANDIQYRVTAADDTTTVDWRDAAFANTTDPVSNTTAIGPLSDGNYTIDLRIVDQSDTPLSYAASSASVSIAVKTTPPRVSLAAQPETSGFSKIGPHNHVIINTSVTAVSDQLTPTANLTIRNASDATVAQWNLSASTGSGQRVTRNWNVTNESGSLVDTGEYTVNITAADGVGNNRTQTTNITVDTTDPVVRIAAVDGGNAHGETRYLNASSEVDVTVAADSNGQDTTAVSEATLTAAATAVNYELTPSLSQSNDDATNWTATLDGSAISEAGNYTLTASATDAANNTNTSAGQRLVYDSTPPDISAVITNVDASAETANVSVRSSESLDGSPVVMVTYPNGTTAPVGVSRTGERWNGTVNASDSGQYVITTTGTDRAGNTGQATATTRVRNDVSTTNKTALVYDSQSGIFIRVNTTESVADRTVALTGTSVAPNELATGQVGVQFLEGALDTTLTDKLKNATVGIPVNQSALPEGIAVDDSQVQIEHYNETSDTWKSQQTRITAVDDLPGSLGGRYWVSTVDSFSAYGVTVNDTSPPELTDATATLSSDEETVTFTATYSDTMSGLNESATTLTIDGSNKTSAANTTITSSKATYTGYPVGDEEYNIKLTLEDTAGNHKQYQRTLTVDTTDDTPPDDDPGGGGGGGAGGAGGGGGGGGQTDQGPPSIAEIKTTLSSFVTPTTTAQPKLKNAETGSQGVTVTPTETQLIDTITFDTEVLSGSVEITEYEDPPELIQQRVSRSIGATDAIDIGGGDGGDSIDVVSVADIKPTTEAAEDSPATVQLQVAKSEVENPQQLTVIKEFYDFEAQKTRWKRLDTTVENTSSDTVTISTQVEDFSLFAVTEVQRQVSAGDKGQQQEGKQQSLEGLPMGLLAVGILLVVSLAIAVVYFRGG